MRLDGRDTIAAIATSAGEGGIGIIRISGPEALTITDKIVRFKDGAGILNKKSHTISLATVIDLSDMSEVDEALVSVMFAPRTYTREDVIEINCHGSNVSLKKTLSLALRAGARPAEPGEFTKRAFLNGRIDLAQAEAVIDIIRARTEAGLKTAVNQLEGGLSHELNKISGVVAEVLAQTEAAVDFSDEDIETLPIEGLIELLTNAKIMCEELLRTAIRGRIIKEGLVTAIIGKPNVGKSSLLNAVLRTERAIVTDIPGTTRDIIEETVNLNGIPLLLKDTAGLREANNSVEKIGVELAFRAIETAELILCVIDGSQELLFEDSEIINKVAGKGSILVINKSDLPQHESVCGLGLPEGIAARVEISALTGEGIESLELAIEEMVFGGEIKTGEALLTSARHEQLLEESRDNIIQAMNLLNDGQPEEVVAIMLRDTISSIGEITGETINNDILALIFSRFCIGK